MPEVTANYIRVPNPNHKCNSDNIRTIDISTSKGIKALYCIDHKKIKTYLFDKEKWDMAEAKKWVEDNAKGMDEVVRPHFAKGYVEKQKGDEEGTLGLCIISDSTVDRHGDKIDAKGWDFKNFKKNPVFLWSHNSGMDENRPAIGKIKDVYEKDGKIFFVPKFDMNDEFAADIHRKYKEGFLNAFSIGFMPLEWSETDTGYNFKRIEALEFSGVNVPANAHALVVLREMDFDVNKDWKSWEKEEKPNDPDEPDENAGLVGEIPDDEEDPEESKWEENFDLVKEKMAEVLSAKEIDEEKYNHLVDLYKKFGRIAPEKKHYEIAVSKVLEGKKIDKGPKEQGKQSNDSKVLIKIIRLIASAKGVPTSLPANLKGKEEIKNG